ncbi:unnamed protein product [Linum tenue]|uniref:Ribosomal protein L34 n=1 Tax=Linum tenue TaxID=586396 RepID=A0AAV0HY13_9ROSI|nr:unnamed protein product [Linum tenue]
MSATTLRRRRSDSSRWRRGLAYHRRLTRRRRPKADSVFYRGEKKRRLLNF